LSGKKKFTIGIDFGTEAVRAILVDVSNGNCVASSNYKYTHGIITDKLPDTDIELDPGSVLQHPRDYITALRRTVPTLIKD
jgi:L-ribulokinase